MQIQGEMASVHTQQKQANADPWPGAREGSKLLAVPDPGEAQGTSKLYLSPWSKQGLDWGRSGVREGRLPCRGKKGPGVRAGGSGGCGVDLLQVHLWGAWGWEGLLSFSFVKQD